MKDIIRMNQLAGIITEGQAKKMMAILNEEESNDVLTQEDFDILRTKGFSIYFASPEHNLFWIERKYMSPKADFRYLNNLLNKKNIPFEIEMFSTDGRGAKQKMVWIDTKYTNASREDNSREI
jgi:hypothetical protein